MFLSEQDEDSGLIARLWPRIRRLVLAQGGGTGGSGVEALDDLTDVTTTGATNGQLLQYSGGTWAPATVSASLGSIDGHTDVNTTSVAPTNGQALLWSSTTSQWAPGSVLASIGGLSINALSDVDTATTPPTSGQVLKWNGSNWAPGTDNSGSGGIADAANDGKRYVRQSAAWAEEIDIHSTGEAATQKRWTDNKIIYRKVVNFGSMPVSGATKQVAHGITGATLFLPVQGMFTDGTYTVSIPYFEGIGFWAACWVDGVDIYGLPEGDWTGWSGYFILEYVK